MPRKSAKAKASEAKKKAKAAKESAKTKAKAAKKDKKKEKEKEAKNAKKQTKGNAANRKSEEKPKPKKRKRSPSPPPSKAARAVRKRSKKEEEEEPESVDEQPAIPFKRLEHSQINVSGKKRKVFKTLKQIMRIESAKEFPPDAPTYWSIQAPPTLLPKKRYCDITGFQAPYTDPKTGLRFCSAEVHQFISTLSPAAILEYLKLRNAPALNQGL